MILSSCLSLEVELSHVVMKLPIFFLKQYLSQKELFVVVVEFRHNLNEILKLKLHSKIDLQ